MPAKKPRDLHGMFEKAFNTRDVNAILSLYEPDAVFVDNGETVIGHEQIREAMHRYLSTHALISMETMLCTEADGLALLHCNWTLSPSSGEPLQGISTEVARRQPDGSWRFLLDNPYTPERPSL